jgi:hypothetical protein
MTTKERILHIADCLEDEARAAQQEEEDGVSPAVLRGYATSLKSAAEKLPDETPVPAPPPPPPFVRVLTPIRLTAPLLKSLANILADDEAVSDIYVNAGRHYEACVRWADGDNPLGWSLRYARYVDGRWLDASDKEVPPA